MPAPNRTTPVSMIRVTARLQLGVGWHVTADLCDADEVCIDQDNLTDTHPCANKTEVYAVVARYMRRHPGAGLDLEFTETR